jgi:hypothetical protein
MVQLLRRKNIINEEYFKIIDNNTKAYILGFLYADGSVSKDGYYLSIEIKEEDIEILNLISNEICITTPKYIYRIIKEKTYVKLIIGSKVICSDLINLGCMPNKTFLLCFPNKNQVKHELVSHFIRGYFDGDGCITSKEKIRPMVTIIGTLEFLNGVFDNLKQEGIDKYSLFKISKIYRLSISNLKDNYIFYNYIYKNAKEYLKRKKNNYDTYYEIMDKNKNKKKTSKYIGVSFDVSRNKWISSYGKKRLGRFKTEQEALEKRNNYIKENKNA